MEYAQVWGGMSSKRYSHRDLPFYATLRIYGNFALFLILCAAAVDSPGMRDYSETTFGMLAAHEPGVFPGIS
jgi:hypothetical protein